MTLPGLFVVGTDTGVGKTHVASAIARSWSRAGRRVGVLKPVASGADFAGENSISSDAERLIEAIGGGVAQEHVALILFAEPLAPPVAARRRGTPLLMADVLRSLADGLAWWRERAEVMVVEGVGGLLCPLAEGATVADLAIALDYPLVIVAHRGLGTLNHTLLTVEAARSRGLRVAGLILNGARPTTDPIVEATNSEELALRLGDVAILADWPHQDGFLHSSVAPEAGDWYDLAKPPRHASEVSRLPDEWPNLRHSSLP
jgi:dethiobiotin synthetase